MEKDKLIRNRKERNISQETIAEKLCMDVSSYLFRT
jgi:transcriptional regulator with XRE-family HTH domain